MNILVITPVTSFGELLRQILEDNERFQPTIVSDAKEAFKAVLEREYALAIIDADIEISLQDVFNGLQAEVPSLKIILLSPESALPSDFQGLAPDACLGKPFYLPAFLETLENVMFDEIPGEEGSISSTPTRERIPVWLHDVDRTAQHLTRLSLETTAQAALIIHNSKIWAYAGQLSQSAADELVQKIAHYWGYDGGSDLARFIHLEETSTEFIIYATSLSEKFVLALAFETEVPFSKIRNQAGELARSLADTPPEGGIPDKIAPKEWQFPLGSPDEGTSSEAFAALLAELNMPPTDATQETELFPKAPGLPKIAVAEEEPPNADKEPQELLLPLRDVESPAVAEYLNIEMADLSSPIPALQNLTYVCALIPRLPRYHLVGNLAKNIDEWMKQLCIAFGWRLEHLAVRPDYLQWIVAVPPSLSPENMLKNLRLHTSMRIFKHFPKFVQENPSGSFWAPGYLMVNGRKPLPMSLLQGFIDKTRLHQGITLQ